MKTFFSGVAVVVLCCAGLGGEALRDGPASGSGKLVKSAAGR
jgi:hypothetical protein